MKGLKADDGLRRAEGRLRRRGPAGLHVLAQAGRRRRAGAAGRTTPPPEGRPWPRRPRRAQVAWPYASFGAPGKVAERKEVADLDAVFVRFDNGVRLTVKPTKFRDDEVLVRVSVGDGLLDLPKDRQSLAWAGSAFIEGGLKQIDNEDIERVLAAKVYGARFAVGEDAFVLSGAHPHRRPADRDAGAGGLRLRSGLARRGVPAAAERRQDRPRPDGRPPTPACSAATSPACCTPATAAGPSRAATRSPRPSSPTCRPRSRPHLASDPDRGGDRRRHHRRQGDRRGRPHLRLPARAPRRPSRSPAGASAQSASRRATPSRCVTHKGRADQAIGYVAWPTNDLWANPQQALENDILGEVMDLRLIDELREAQGVTYSPSVSYTHSLTWTGWGYLAASVEVPPAKLDGFFDDVAKIAADLRTKPTSRADELDRAKKPRSTSSRSPRVTNQYWLARALRRPGRSAPARLHPPHHPGHREGHRRRRQARRPTGPEGRQGLQTGSDHPRSEAPSLPFVGRGDAYAAFRPSPNTGASSGGRAARPRIMSATFSAIMMVGALVLPPTSVGMTEASTTRRPAMPLHPQLGVDHRHRVARRAHPAGADRVVDRLGRSA